MWSTRTIFLVIALWPLSLHAATKYASFPAVGVELPLPEGYSVSTKWVGLHNEAKQVAVQISVIPGPLSETSAGFTPQQIASRHATLLEKTETTIAGKQAVLIHMTQPGPAGDIDKWLAIVGDEKSTTLLVAQLPIGDDKEGSVVKSILTGARAIEIKRRPLGENVDFKVGKSTKLRLDTDDNNTLSHSAIGTTKPLAPSDAIFLAVKSGDVFPPGDIRKYLQAGLMRLAETDITHFDPIRIVDLGPDCRACEVIAIGEHKSSRTTRVIFERMIAYPDCCYLMVGIVGEEQRDEFLPEFQKMADGFVRTSPVDRAALAENNPRGAGLPRPHSARSQRVFKPGNAWEPSDVADERPGKDEPRNEGDAPAGRDNVQKKGGRTARARSVLPARPKTPLPDFQYEADTVQVTSQRDGHEGKQFLAPAPAGGVLVGLRVSQGDAFSGSVRAITPIYQVKDRYIVGKPFGDGAASGKLLLAPPGFAVGGVQIASGLWMDALRLIYMPIEANTLDVSKREYSDWVGGDGGGMREIVSDGGLIVGVAGYYGENMESLQLMYVLSDDVQLVAATESSTEKSEFDDNRELRTWKSANGKFNISAKLDTVEGNNLKLVTQDGRRVAVPLDKLSAADQKYVQDSDIESENPFKIEASDGGASASKRAK